MLGEEWRRVLRLGRIVMRQDNQAALDAAFRLTLDFANVSEHQGWRTARERVLAALAAGPGLVALLGPAGTGKTLLLRDLARSLRAAGREAELVGRGDLPCDASTSAVVLVDEAARMDVAALSSLATSGVAAVLADLPGLETHLDNLGIAVTVVRLEPLLPDEIGAFVADRLARAGQPTDLLTADAVAALAVHSSGVPRVLNLLARAALFMAETEGAARVEERHVSLAVALRDGEISEMDAEIPAPSKSPDIRAQFGPVPLAGISLDEVRTSKPFPSADAEAFPDTSPAGVPASAVPDAVAPELPTPPALPAVSDQSRARRVRHSVALLAASAVVASFIAGWSHRPYLASTVRAALAFATPSPTTASDRVGASPVENQSP